MGDFELNDEIIEDIIQTDKTKTMSRLSYNKVNIENKFKICKN